MSAFMACANKTAFSTAALFKTGRVPGSPLQIGQIFVFGSSPHESALHAQKILLFVFSCMCVSNPITISYSDINILLSIDFLKPVVFRFAIAHFLWQLHMFYQFVAILLLKNLDLSVARPMAISSHPNLMGK